jgi:hypothetical protein
MAVTIVLSGILFSYGEVAGTRLRRPSAATSELLV